MVFSCKNCKIKFTSLQIAFSWPTKISCKGCKTKHYFNHGNAVGILSVLMAITAGCAAILIMNAVSLASEANGIYRMSGLQILVFFIWPVIYILPYIAFLKYYKFELKRQRSLS